MRAVAGGCRMVVCLVNDVPAATWNTMYKIIRLRDKIAVLNVLNEFLNENKTKVWFILLQISNHFLGDFFKTFFCSRAALLVQFIPELRSRLFKGIGEGKP